MKNSPSGCVSRHGGDAQSLTMHLAEYQTYHIDKEVFDLKKKKSDQPINWEKPRLTPPHPTFYWSVNGSSSFFTIQQVAPQAAKTMSPPFARMGGFGGGSSTSFDQMPTGASPTTTSGANYPAHNVRASLNNNGYGRLCA